MVNVVSVGEFDLDGEALHAATDTYLDFKSADEDQRGRTRDILDSGHSWLNQRDLTADTVSQYTSELREGTGDDHPILSGEDFDDLEAKVADDAGSFVEDLVALFEDESPLEDRIERFRTNQGIDLTVISALLTTSDPDQYVLYDEEGFETLIRYFTGLHSPDLGDLSVGRRYDLYRNYCSTIQMDVLSEKLVDATLQDAQEFVRTVTHSAECRYNLILRYFFRHTRQLEEFEEETSVFLDEIRMLPQAFLRDQLEAYEGRQKIAKIRYDVLDAILDDESVDIDKIAARENVNHEKNIMNSWDDYKILAQIYYNYAKDRVEAYIEDLLDYLRNEIDADQLSTHYVTYQGATNIPNTRSWAVLYPSVLGDHKSAYQLYIYFYPNEIEYGIDNGSDVPRKEYDDESFESEDEISIQNVVEAYRERLDTFWRWNEELIEEPDSAEYDELSWFESVEKHLQRKKQIVFHGPPGTGKTYGALNFAKWWIDRGLDEQDHFDDAVEGRLRIVTFHPTFSYEDFIEGITAKTRDGDLVYEPEAGVFKEMAEDAVEAYEDADSKADAPRYILIIDEVNRGNIPKIFGETITLIENDKRLGELNEMRDELPHSEDRLVVPPNLYIIGTMNTADRSIALVDAAIRRRFRFRHFPPNCEVLYDELGFDGEQDVKTKASVEEGEDLGALSILALSAINERIRDSGNLGKGKQVGHSYLIGGTTDERLVESWKNEILPLLDEYYFGDMERLKEHIFDGGGENLFNWKEQRIADFDSDALRAALSELVDEDGGVE
ncbi:AAA-type ATPase domain protein [Natronomonas moolapensis 8.8.11]|uniref:AAA-type ATPase domain protein n=1 Tax=Natronomonas moolapensis (strain DSM 18674 / CECT 7526 / JCM 14361 / 8.8.11) TaxID=268739 RepID=M1XRA3_NATM8|nr:AAA family ATPase [Natronomonas moolapensis]CCQ36742.1 AAA-type ATPase domain protein [Natronomonas moolapensis 8.8.11]